MKILKNVLKNADKIITTIGELFHDELIQKANISQKNFLLFLTDMIQI